MSNSFSYSVQAPASGGSGSDSGGSSSFELSGLSLDQFFGRGILRPFRRDQKNDFANGSGIALLSSNVGQVLQTKRGELPWRTEQGSRVHLLRHRNQTEPLFDELVRVYVIEALSRWERRISVKAVSRVGTSIPTDNTPTFLVVYDVVDSAGRVVVADQEALVPLSL